MEKPPFGSISIESYDGIEERGKKVKKAAKFKLYKLCNENPWVPDCVISLLHMLWTTNQIEAWVKRAQAQIAVT